VTVFGLDEAYGPTSTLAGWLAGRQVKRDPPCDVLPSLILSRP
jgi:hypothetical protein